LDRFCLETQDHAIKIELMGWDNEKEGNGNDGGYDNSRDNRYTFL